MIIVESGFSRNQSNCSGSKSGGQLMAPTTSPALILSMSTQTNQKFTAASITPFIPWMQNITFTENLKNSVTGTGGTGPALFINRCRNLILSSPWHQCIFNTGTIVPRKPFKFLGLNVHFGINSTSIFYQLGLSQCTRNNCYFRLTLQVKPVFAGWNKLFKVY